MSSPVRRAVFLGVVVLMAVAAPGAARAQTATPSPTTAPGPTVAGAQDQVMLSGSVLVPLKGEPTYMNHGLAWSAENRSPALRAVLEVAEEVLPTPSPE